MKLGTLFSFLASAAFGIARVVEAEFISHGIGSEDETKYYKWTWVASYRYASTGRCDMNLHHEEAINSRM